LSRWRSGGPQQWKFPQKKKHTELPQIEIAAILYAEWKFISNRTDFRTKALTENYSKYCLAVEVDISWQAKNDSASYSVTAVIINLETRFVHLSFSQSYNIFKGSVAQRM